MGCKGICQIEQNEWKEELVPDFVQVNGQPFTNPQETGKEAYPATATDAEIWKDQDLSKFTFTILVETMVGYREPWLSGVERMFPASRRLNCKSKKCICDLADPPTVVEGWSKWERMIVSVPQVSRNKVNGSNQSKITVHRALLKGTVQHRKRVVQGLCRRNPNIEHVLEPTDKVHSENE